MSIWPTDDPRDALDEQQECEECQHYCDVQLCSLKGEDVYLCADCREEFFCDECGYPHEKCDCVPNPAESWTDDDACADTLRGNDQGRGAA